MDQNSSDTEKRNWRERLGIGAKDLPKIAGEFAKPAEPVLVSPAGKSGTANDGGPPVVVAKPAPMAPRVAAKPAPAKAAPASRPMQPSAPTSPDVLAERLRNQREAAEKLAEQRVNNAKERAEANKAAQQQQQPSAAAAGAPPPQQRQQRPSGNGNRPKFSFAEDDARTTETKRDPRGAQQGRPSAPPPRTAAVPQSPPAQSMQPQLSPARPPLGGAGDRFVNPQAPPPRQMPPQTQPTFSPPPQFRPQASGAPAYRPIDPATGYTPPPSFQMPRGTMAPPQGGPRPPAMPGMSSGMAGDPRLQSGPYIADSYGAPPPPMGGIPRYDQLNRNPSPPPPLRNDHLRPQTHSYEGDMQDDIFEDGPAIKPRRASQSDYSQAYHPDAEMDYRPRRRSSGPLMLLMLLGVAAAVGIGGVLYYQNMLKVGSDTTSNGEVPVVPAPAEPGKTTAESGSAAQPNSSSAQPSKKQIYDRIVGEREVLGGQMVPTEEVPVQPALDQSTQPAALPQPTNGTGGDEPLPLPLPPPVNGNTQGNAVDGSTQQPAAASAEPIPQPAAPGTTVTATGYTGEQQQQMAAAAQQQTLIEDPPPAAPAAAQAVEDPPPAAKPAKPKAAAKPKPKKKVETAAKNLGEEPVVLVPPEDGTALTQDPAVTLDGEPALQGATPVEQPVKKKKTLLGLFTGENKRIDEQSQAAGIDAATEPQVAAVNTPRQVASKQVAPEQPQEIPSAAKTGFTLQLSSFSSEQEARAEYKRIASKHSSTVNGLSPIIAPVSAGGSTRYQLSLGTVSTVTQAQGLCKNLISSGLRDCSVRRR